MGSEKLGRLEHTPELRNETKLVLKTPSKFHLADLPQVHVHYLRMFPRGKMLSLSLDQTVETTENTEIPLSRPLVVESPVGGERWNGLPSQVSSMPVEQLDSELDEAALINEQTVRIEYHKDESIQSRSYACDLVKEKDLPCNP